MTLSIIMRNIVPFISIVIFLTLSIILANNSNILSCTIMAIVSHSTSNDFIIK